MLGVLALLVCVGAAVAAGRILYFLYAPKLVRLEGLARVPGDVVIEPLFAARRAPAPPRTRMARGTGGVTHAPVREERTDKVSALPLR